VKWFVWGDRWPVWERAILPAMQNRVWSGLQCCGRQRRQAGPAWADSAVWQMQIRKTAGCGMIQWMARWPGRADGGQCCDRGWRAHWTRCAVPDAEKTATLIFVGAGVDAETAIVWQRRREEPLYKTADGCGTWRLLFTNPTRRLLDSFVAAIWPPKTIVSPLQARTKVIEERSLETQWFTSRTDWTQPR